MSDVTGYGFPISTYVNVVHLAALSIAPDENVVAAALPRIADLPTLADFFMLPTMTTLSLTGEGQAMLASKPRIAAWRARMEALPSVVEVGSMVMPHVGKPVEHARRGVIDHRPAVRTS